MYLERTYCALAFSVACLGGLAPAPPLSDDPNFYDGFCCCIIFSRTSKFRHLLTKKRQLLGTSPFKPRPLPELCPWTPRKSPRPPGPLLSNILNTPLGVLFVLVSCFSVFFYIFFVFGYVCQPDEVDHTWLFNPLELSYCIVSYFERFGCGRAAWLRHRNGSSAADRNIRNPHACGLRTPSDQGPAWLTIVHTAGLRRAGPRTG